MAGIRLRLIEDLLTFLNQRLQDVNFDESLYITILQMISKVGDLRELANWRPIAVHLFVFRYFQNKKELKVAVAAYIG